MTNFILRNISDDVLSGWATATVTLPCGYATVLRLRMHCKRAGLEVSGVAGPGWGGGGEGMRF